MAQPGPQFKGFHGTSAPLQPGDSVLPPSKSGARQINPPRGYRKPEYDPVNVAHASTKEKVAWAFGNMTAERTGQRASVKEVTAPKDTVRPGVENRHNPDWTPHHWGGQLPDNKEYVSPQFKVVDSIEIQPPESVRLKTKHMRYGPNPDGRQGTLPLDWRPFSNITRNRGTKWETTGPMSSGEANHPTGNDIKREKERIAEQEAARQPAPPPKGKGGMKQPMLPGMRGAVKRKGKA